ncbi:DNA methylase N-4/N-6 domain-containing protein [Thermosipho africanus Ob7]|uniref:DNA-methyltransferase n=1 Tax=Thermosipho africanus TaxID=2421 RepID=UPI000E0B8872|nr:site-specific DNA-methyltransferase [Thermosipho africanus]RDI91122.1 DNA methylase N-4/N-6 domain-containing protein [Thermosipho africanus Ob7]
MNIWEEIKGVKLINKDFLETYIPENSIDLIVTSPPYNVEIPYNFHNDKITYEDYLIWTEKWLTKAYKLAKPDGRMCLNIPLDKNKGGKQSVYADIVYLAKKVGWKYQSTIIWNEGNISRRTAWGSWLSASAPYVIAPVETIVILYKNVWKKQRKGESDILKNEFIEWTNGLWTFSGESKKRIGHPAPFPLELPKRCIKLFSYVGDVVLDPFLGSGTTVIAAYKLKRKAIGVEIDKKYFELAIERVSKQCFTLEGF